MRQVIRGLCLPFAIAACVSSEPTAPIRLPDAVVLGLGTGNDEPGAVYVISNSPGGNAVLAFGRGADGLLGAPVSYPTGGLGTGGGLGNQSAIVLSANGRNLYAVNPASDNISTFRVTAHGLEHLGTVPSGGDLPISLALHGDLLYALNDGVSPNVAGFRVGTGGLLTPIAGSVRALSAAVPDAAQVGISPNGQRLVVTEKATNLIVGWDIGQGGLLSGRTLTPSASPTPFGFDFDERGTLLVSEAVGGAPNASVLSSYRPGAAGWVAVSPSVATTETAACWVVVTPNGRYAYVTNTGSSTISGFEIGNGGTLDLLDADGVTGSTPAGPIDAAVSGNGRFLYTLNAGADGLSVFRIRSDGSLESLATVAGLPNGATGLSAR